MQKQRKTTKATTSELILEALREQIINGTLVSQEKLVESEIAQQFGTSRGPVRDALRQLAVELSLITHLTLPTNREVEISVGAGSLKKKEVRSDRGTPGWIICE